MRYLKKNMILTLVVCGVTSFMPVGVFAQNGAVDADDFLKRQVGSGSGAQTSSGAVVETVKELTVVEKGIAEAKAELKDKEILAKKIALAKKMHTIRSTREQVDSAVRRASFSLAANERDGFINAMRSMLNYNAIERISIDAMIEIYTLKELEVMVDYYSKPEAKSASDKVLSWAQIIQPEIVHMIDKAMMRIRTGQ